ncbi:hypothetical protein OMP43_09420 [Sphingomonas sp. CBMAI 2297]|uniref:hypothetical protein n=1 Tax=Sphingomonas sp. CBMAI 2297 TaxID=2991720 RepID=UPI00245718DF|nr:hypothetical protein [Sphingomonas sp. CBMAI 2297]MDH4744234.1 hypothetical protein [Sphingomonas sp. CBMAI 2297]
MSESETKPDLGLMLYDSLPEGFEAGLLEGLAGDGLTLRTLRIPGGPFAGIELYLPAAAMLFIATGYLNGFLQKAGEDHYELVKQAATKLWKRASSLQVTRIGSKGKVSDTGFSLAYAIMGEVAGGLRFKFIVRTTIEETEADAGVRAFLDLLLALQSGELSQADTQALLTYQPIGGTVLVTFDPHAKRIVPVNAFDPEAAQS